MKKFYLILKIILCLLMIYRFSSYIFAEEPTSGSTAVVETDVDPRDEASVMSTYQGYDGSISSTYSDYFKGIILKNITDDYVVARTSQYEYILAYGDLSYTSYFSGSANTVIINTNTYNTDFDISYGYDSSFILYPNNNMIYSSLGNYPSLIGGELLDVVEIFCCAVLIFERAIYSIFNIKSR